MKLIMVHYQYLLHYVVHNVANSTIVPAGWGEAERKEIDNHLLNETMTTMDKRDLPRGRRTVRMTWVYKKKRDGTMKARLCVQGCSQVHGVDYDQVWSGTLRASSLRMLSSLAAKEKLHMRRWDFVAAYLQGELLDDEVVYCSMPPGYTTGLNPSNPTGEGACLRINKPIYGMAQAGRRWQRTIFSPTWCAWASLPPSPTRASSCGAR